MMRARTLLGRITATLALSLVSCLSACALPSLNGVPTPGHTVPTTAQGFGKIMEQIHVQAGKPNSEAPNLVGIPTSAFHVLGWVRQPIPR